MKDKENEVIENAILVLSQYVQAFSTDAYYYYSGKPTLSTPERKAILQKGLITIKDSINIIEQNLL